MGGFFNQAQLRPCREFAQREGWTLVRGYGDEASSTFRPRE